MAKDRCRCRLETVENKVRHIVKHQWKPDADYVFFNWAQANKELDNIKRPVVVFVVPVSGSLRKQWYQFSDRPYVQIGFLCNSDFDFKTKTNDALMQSMKELAMQFILEVNKSGFFEPIGDNVEIPYQAVYDYLDQNTTGIIITIELKEINGVKYCNNELQDE